MRLIGQFPKLRVFSATCARLAALIAFGSVTLLQACGTIVEDDTPSGGESHFLDRCTDTCGSTLDCISGVCTRGCAFGGDSCSELLVQAVCTLEPSEFSNGYICDVECASDLDCVSVGPNALCEASVCRSPDPARVPELESTGGGELVDAAYADGDGGSLPDLCNASNWTSFYPELQGCFLTGADLTGADLTGANLTNTAVFDLVNCPAVLPSAEFRCLLQSALGTFAIVGPGISLVGADLSAMDLSGVNLEGASWGNTTCPDGTNSDAYDGQSCQGHLVP